MSKRGGRKLETHRPRGFMRFDRVIYDSYAYKSLSFIERGVLLHLMYHYIPKFREVIVMSNRRLARETAINKDTAGRALRRLEKVGLIRLVDESDWYRGTARSYRLTFMTYQGRQPTDEWVAHQREGQVSSDNVTSVMGQHRRLSPLVNPE